MSNSNSAATVQTVTHRVLFICRKSQVDNCIVPPGIGPGGCGKFWQDVELRAGRAAHTAHLPRCPFCNGWRVFNLGALRVERSAQAEPTHTCENTCQWSESRHCRCACGGKLHGLHLRDERR